MFEQELVGKPIQPGEIYLMGTVLKVRQRRSRAFVGAFGVHKLGALRAVHPHVLRVRSGPQKPCGLAGRTFLNSPFSS